MEWRLGPYVSRGNGNSSINSLLGWESICSRLTGYCVRGTFEAREVFLRVKNSSSRLTHGEGLHNRACVVYIPKVELGFFCSRHAKAG